MPAAALRLPRGLRGHLPLRGLALQEPRGRAHLGLADRAAPARGLLPAAAADPVHAGHEPGRQWRHTLAFLEAPGHWRYSDGCRRGVLAPLVARARARGGQARGDLQRLLPRRRRRRPGHGAGSRGPRPQLLRHRRPDAPHAGRVELRGRREPCADLQVAVAGGRPHGHATTPRQPENQARLLPAPETPVDPSTHGCLLGLRRCVAGAFGGRGTRLWRLPGLPQRESPAHRGLAGPCPGHAAARARLPGLGGPAQQPRPSAGKPRLARRSAGGAPRPGGRRLPGGRAAQPCALEWP
mmetsp:Transcript_85570/g.266049  ORF Transcript_85570/g.266049 Transcript_85570/m.266049 type:complete len:296 (-) Transcript_85570:231-1118(-)